MAPERERTAFRFALMWSLLALAGLACSVISRYGLFRLELPWWSRATLAATECFLLAAPVAVAAVLWDLFERVIRARRSRAAAVALRALRGTVLGLAFFAFLWSWAEFLMLDHFFDHLFLEWVFADVKSLAPYFAGKSLFTQVLALGLGWALVAGAGAFLPSLGSPGPGLRRNGIRMVWLALLVLGGAAITGDVASRAVSGRVEDPGLGISCTFAEYYRIARDQHAGPAAHALANWGRRAPEAPASGPGLRIIRPLLRSIPDYLAGIDPRRLNRLNVVLVLADGLRVDQFHAGGSPRTVLGAMEAVAREGRLFTDCTAMATHTDYSAPSIVASQYPLRDPVDFRYPEPLGFPRVLLYQLLKPLGYHTALASSFAQDWRGMNNYLQDQGLDHTFDPDSWPGPPPADTERTAIYRWREGIPGADIDDRFTVEDSMHWIDGLNGEPFFLYLNLQNSHFPYAAPPGFHRPFGHDYHDFMPGRGTWSPENIAEARDIYADSLAYIDRQLGALVDHLKQQGLWDRTIFILGGDHGEAFYEHRELQHGGPLFQEEIKIPLLLRIPGLPPGIDARPAQLFDVPPTVCHALGLPPHPGFQGSDLLTPQTHERSRFLIVQTPMFRQEAVLRGRYKLIFDELEGHYSLYDLIADPGEKQDIAVQRPEVLADLKKRLAAWYRVQLDYYQDKARLKREYPPLLVDLP